MYAEITAALTGLKTLGELTALVIRTKADSAITEKAIESQSVLISVQNTILTLQAQYHALLEEKQALKKQLADIEDWNTEATKYELHDMGDGVFVYVQRPEHKTLAPAHWLCARCYNEKYKSILQRTSTDRSGNIFYCQKCENTLTIQTTPSTFLPIGRD
jgi:hypothetical protein